MPVNTISGGDVRSIHHRQDSRQIVDVKLAVPREKAGQFLSRGIVSRFDGPAVSSVFPVMQDSDLGVRIR